MPYTDHSAHHPKLRSLLRIVQDCHMAADIVTAGIVSDVRQTGNTVDIALTFPYPAQGYVADIRAAIVAQLETIGLTLGQCTYAHDIAVRAVQQNLKPLESVKNVIAVASGKGGVGKSTTAVNIALALAQDGARIALLDADIYGPNIPHMLGITAAPETTEQGLLPLRAHGIECMSMAALVDKDTPMIWRGPMVTQALHQLLHDTKWQAIDYMVIDLPPGTGDVQLSLAQRIPVSGIAVVTTPQEIALLDARRAIQMFRKVNVPILGIIENMQYFDCPNCGHTEHIFGSGGADGAARQYDVPLLGGLPLNTNIRNGTDNGVPTVVDPEQAELAAKYHTIARRLTAQLARQRADDSHIFPTITVA